MSTLQRSGLIEGLQSRGRSVANEEAGLSLALQGTLTLRCGRIKSRAPCQLKGRGLEGPNCKALYTGAAKRSKGASTPRKPPKSLCPNPNVI